MGGGPVGVHQHTHFERVHSSQVDAGHAGQTFQRFLQVALQRLVLVRQVLVSGQTDGDNGLVTGRPGADDHAFGTRRQVGPNGIQLGAHFEGSRLHVATPTHRDLHFRTVSRRSGANLFDTGQGSQGFFDGAGDKTFHFLGRRAGIGDVDEDPREGDVRHLLERQLAGTDEADDRQRRKGHPSSDWAGECSPGVPHGLRSLRPVDDP